MGITGCQQRRYQPDIPVTHYFQGGFIGVDVFFVISGYLITKIIREQVHSGTFTFRAFYLRRVRRLAPALIFTLAVTLAFAAALQAPGALKDTSEAIISAFFSVSNIYFWKVSGYFGPDLKIQPMLHTWSLSVEEQFYLLWPAVLVALLSRGRRFGVPLFLVAAGLASLVLAEIVLRDDTSAAFFLMPFRIVEFAIGAGLVWLEPHRPRWPWLAEALCAFGLALILGTTVSYSSTTPFPGATALVPCLGAALVILFGGCRYTGWLLRNEAARRIGLISYSLYLVHWPIIAFFRYQTLAELSRSQKVALFVASICAAALMYRFIEQPFRRPSLGTDQRRQKIRWSVAALGAVLVPLTAVSATSGWYWRFGPRAEELVSLKRYHAVHFGGLGCKAPGCSANVSESSPKPRIYVLGDSHAAALYAGLREVLPDYELKFWWTSACQIFSLEYDSPKIQRKDCDAVRRAAFADIASRNGIVIVAQFWGIGRLGMEERLSGQKMPFSSDAEFATFASRQLRELKKFLGAQKLIVIGDVPTFGTTGSPLDCMSRLLMRPARCLSSDSSRAELLNAAMAAESGDDYVFVNPVEALCKGGSCSNFMGNVPIYSDENHLSEAGSVHTMRTLEPELRRALEEIPLGPPQTVTSR